jgi:hypothetical protein
VLLGILDSLADGFCIFSGFAKANADMTIAITNYDERSNTEASAAFDHLGNAANLNYCLFQV